MDTNDIVIEIGKRIFEIRSDLGMSQADLARTAKISTTYLGEIERGKRTNISIAVVARIVKSLDVSLSELFFDIEKVSEK